jgi:hypothetical protein
VVEGDLVAGVQTHAEVRGLVDSDAVHGGHAHRKVQSVVVLRRQVDQRGAKGDGLADVA